MVTSATADTRSLGQLVNDLFEQVKRLVQAEIDLAKEELATKAKRAGIGSGLFVAAGVVVFFAVGVAIATVILALAVALPAWLAALIVFVLLLVTAAALAYAGRRQLKKSSEAPMPQPVQRLREDVAAVKEGLRT